MLVSASLKVLRGRGCSRPMENLWSKGTTWSSVHKSMYTYPNSSVFIEINFGWTTGRCNLQIIHINCIHGPRCTQKYPCPLHSKDEQNSYGLRRWDVHPPIFFMQIVKTQTLSIPIHPQYLHVVGHWLSIFGSPSLALDLTTGHPLLWSCISICRLLRGSRLEGWPLR